MQSFHLDTSDDSSEEEEQKIHGESDKQPINIKSHIMKNQIEVQGGLKKNQRKDNQLSKDSLEDAIFKNDFNALSRRDLSARYDENNLSKIETSKERKNKFHRNNQDHHDDKDSWSRNRKDQIDDSSSSLNLFHRLLSSGHNNINPKINSQTSSVLLSNPDFNMYSQYRQGENQIIFEQPTKEDALEDTYKGGQTFKNSNKNELVLKAEDLTTILEQGYMSQNESSQLSQQNDILNTYKQHVMKARTNLNHNEAPLQKKSFNSHKNSINVQQPLSDKQNYQQSANPDRQRQVIGQSNRNSNMKDVNVNLDQKSDFTFVLSNPTEFQCECNGIDTNTNNSFVTQKFQKAPSTAQNSEMKSQKQNFSSYRKGPFQTLVQPSRIQDFGASPIYSENGGPPGSQFYINQPVDSCNNCGGCKNNTRKQNKVQHRLSYNQINHQSIKEESQDEDDEYYQNQNFIDSQIEDSQQNPPQVIYDKVFEYQQQISKQQHIISGETSVEENHMKQTKSSSQDEELKKLQTIISFSQEYMSRLLQDQSVSVNLKSQLVQILGAISSVYQPTPSHHHKSNLTQMQSNHLISQQTTLQPASTFLDNNMTMSELHQIQRQQIRMHNQHNNNNIIHEEVSTQQDDSIYSNQGSQEQDYNDNKYKIAERLPKNLKRKYQNLKSSLISSSCEDPQFNQMKEDTILSYIDQDDDEMLTDDDSFDREEKRIKIKAFQTLRQSEFQQSSSQQTHTGRKLKQSQGAFHKVTEIKKSLKQTKKHLLSTKQQLKRERIVNQQQENNMKKLEAQIEALTERWKMTEENIKAKENAMNIVQRINSTNSTNIASSYKITTAQQSATSYIRRDQSPNIQSQTVSSNNCQSHNNFIPISSNQNNTSQSHLDQSSKHLLEINDRLTKQIEDNLMLFENLNEELTLKDRTIAENQAKLQDKQKEVEILMKKINDMGENMKSLIEITKNTSDATEQSKIKHQEDMDKIKRRQSDYQRKIDKINSVFANIPDVSNNSLLNNTNEGQIYSKYQKRQTLGASTVLNCIPLNSPGSAGVNIPINQSINSSRIQDEEFSIGQIGTKQSIDNDLLPYKLSQINRTHNKENIMKNEDTSLLNSNVLNSLYNNLKESVKTYNNIQSNNHQQQPSSFMNNTNESTMMKYSQDITQSLQNTMINRNN